MKQNEISKLKINIFFSILLQIVTTICGLIVPSIILNSFGSETNGLVNSIHQFLNYITLLEGGVTGVISASLYKPLRENNIYKVNAIINAAKSFFQKIGVIYIVYLFAVSIIYPIVVKTEYDNIYVSLLTIVLGLGLIFEYFLSLHLQVLIRTDRKVYVISIATIIVKLLNLVLVILSATLFKDIVILKLFSSLIFLIYPFVYSFYVRKHYSLDNSVPPDKEALSQRWDGFGQNIAYFIHANTDVVILTFFSLKLVSVYSIYYLISNAIKCIVASFSSAITPSFGNTMAGDDLQEKNKAFDLYSLSVYFVSTLLFSCAIVLIIPFMKIYTANITDANYIEPLFGILLLLSHLMYCYRDPYLVAAYVTNHFKDTAIFAYVEAGLNITISLLLVARFNLVGIAIGTLVSFFVRLVLHAVFLEKNILFRPIIKFIKAFVVFLSGCFLSCFICFLLKIGNSTNYFMWTLSGFQSFFVVFVVLLLLMILFYKNETIIIVKKFLRIGNK